MAEQEIRNLHVKIEEKQILKGLDLDVEKGRVHALMGPNGSGKSTLANVIMGHPAYEVTEGSITFKGEDITEAAPEDRSQAGLFMAFQYPVAVPGVTITRYLRTVLNAHREQRGDLGDQGGHVALRGRFGRGHRFTPFGHRQTDLSEESPTASPTERLS